MNIRIVEERLPETIKGFTGRKENDDYTILLNTELSDTEKAAAFLHEMLHIWHNDFASGKSVDQIEQERHAEMEKIMEILLEQ